MTYSVGGGIQASDYNGFANTNPTNVNLIWSTGVTNSGYGQPALSTVSQNEIIAASNWNSLISNINSSASHQGSSLASWRDSNPAINDIVLFETNLSSNIITIYNNRLNAAAQGSTTVPSNGTATSSITWSNSLTMTFNVQFSSANAIRYFFNAGGQISLAFSHPAGVGTSINQRISDLASDAGTVWLSSPTSGTVSLSSINYSGVTKVGGSNPSGATINANNGYYALGLSSTQLFQQTSDSPVYVPYSSTFLRINATTNTSTGLLTMIVLWDEVPNGAVVSTGTTGTLSIRYPSTTYLTNTWGTPTVSNSIVGS